MPDPKPLTKDERALFRDPDPCEYDHHGYCQAHSLDERPCPHERAAELTTPKAGE